MGKFIYLFVLSSVDLILFSQKFEYSNFDEETHFLKEVFVAAASALPPVVPSLRDKLKKERIFFWVTLCALE